MYVSYACPRARAGLRVHSLPCTANAKANSSIFSPCSKRDRAAIAFRAIDDPVRSQKIAITSNTPTRFAVGLEHGSVRTSPSTLAPRSLGPPCGHSLTASAIVITEYTLCFSVSQTIGQRRSETKTKIGRRLPHRRPVAVGPHPLQPGVHRGGEQHDYPQSSTNCNNYNCIRFGQ